MRNRKQIIAALVAGTIGLGGLAVSAGIAEATTAESAHHPAPGATKPSKSAKPRHGRLRKTGTVGMASGNVVKARRAQTEWQGRQVHQGHVRHVRLSASVTHRRTLRHPSRLHFWSARDAVLAPVPDPSLVQTVQLGLDELYRKLDQTPRLTNP
jgi:hypothetical protein